jgi:hypothetical protein
VRALAVIAARSFSGRTGECWEFMDREALSTQPHRCATERFLRFLWRYIAAGSIAFVAIAGGIYFGFSLAVRNASSGPAIDSLNESYLEVGDSVPAYQFRDARSNQLATLAGLVGQKPAILLFVSHSCRACEALAAYWERKVIPDIAPDFVVLEVHDDDERRTDSLARKPPGLLVGAIQVFMDRESYATSDGIFATPTVVALDGDHRVALICSGFHRSVGADLIRKRAMP